MSTKSSSVERQPGNRHASRRWLPVGGAAAGVIVLFGFFTRIAETDRPEKLVVGARPDADWSDNASWDNSRAAFDGSLDLFVESVRRNPADAVALAHELSQQNPSRSSDHGQWLVDALMGAGAFDTAFVFLRDETSSRRAAWLQQVFATWGANDPARALQQAAALGRAEDSEQARDAALSGWAAADPEQAARFSIGLSERQARTRALDAALPRWVERDAVGAAAWLEQFDPLTELDAGAEALAILNQRSGGEVRAGLAWAASIADPTRRANTLHAIGTDGAMSDESAVSRFVEETAALSELDRRTLRDAIASSKTP